jgi:hypothetical protein
MRGVGGACKYIHRPLLHSARVYCLTTATVTPQGYENKRLPLHSLTSSRIVNHRLPVILFATEERERKDGKK